MIYNIYIYIYIYIFVCACVNCCKSSRVAKQSGVVMNLSTKHGITWVISLIPRGTKDPTVQKETPFATPSLLELMESPKCLIVLD